MRVVCAGFNIEAEGVRLLHKLTGLHFTPEVISAAYARVTRDPRSVEALRREARREVERARDSNERIVFEMGHSSVAEHAAFNFDIMNVSRLAVEEIEHFRLASFTEKSQRYIRLGRDLVVPDEVRAGHLEDLFCTVMHDLFRNYGGVFERIRKVGETKGVAREDARYVMPLATSAQLGMTINARELEYMISRLASHPLGELRRLSGKLYQSVRHVAPSLVRYPEPTRYYAGMQPARDEIGAFVRARRPSQAPRDDMVRLRYATPSGDTMVAATLLFSARSVNFGEAVEIASGLSQAQRNNLITRTMVHLQSHDSVWREFENVHLLFEVIASASCFAQIKRHRMATLITQPYDTSLGVSIPASVRSASAVTLMRRSTTRSERLYRLLREKVGEAAMYALTNAHRRRLLIGMNLRELYHFSRLRSDSHAQWEIRELSERMCALAVKRMPAAAALLGGKDTFGEKKRSIVLDKKLYID